MRASFPICLLLVACGGGGSEFDAGPMSIDGATDGGDSPILIGRVELAEFFNRGSAQAVFFDGGFPRFQTEVQSDGTCVLSKSAPAFCNEPCDGFCVGPDQCEPFRTRLSAGDIVFSGLAEPLTLEARALGQYSPVPFPVPDELFSAGTTVTATAAGDAVSAFSLTAKGVDAIVTNVPDGRMTLLDAEDFVFTWATSGVAGERVMLHIDVPATAHGLPIAAVLECDVAEADGSLTVPKEMIAELPALDEGADACGNIDCGRRVLARYARSSADTSAGTIELVIASQQPLFITH